MFVKTIRRYIDYNSLLSTNGLHLVALSGGADSVALLRVLLQLGYNVEAMHCNFNLRGEESIRDEEFCKALCSQLNVPLHLAHFDTRFYSQQHNVSIEMAARELRYSYFRQLHKELDAESICVAHHREDNAETILMNLVRGTGLAGLAGIRNRNDMIIRPLLSVSRKDIEDYLATLQQPYVTDSTNLINDVKRNKVRLDIMPAISLLNPSATESIVQTAKHVADAMPLLEDALNRYEAECVGPLDDQSTYYDGEETDNFHAVFISIERLMQTPSPEYLLFHILTKRGIPSQLTPQVFSSLSGQTGKSWQIAGRILTIDRGRLLIERQHSEFRTLKIPMTGKYCLCNGDRLEVSILDRDETFTIDTSPDVAQLDADTVRWPLTIRAVATGDRFVPFGMTGSKLVSDLLTDRKMTLQQKRRQLCVTDASEQIIWLTGLRTSNKHRITSHTIKYVLIRYIKRRV